MTESEELVARLDDIILDELLHLARPGAELQMAARQVRQALLNSGLLVSASASQATIAGLERERDYALDQRNAAIEDWKDERGERFAIEADAAGLRAALEWSMDEIDVLSNKLCQFAYPQGMALVNRRDQLDSYRLAVDARRRALTPHQEGKE